MGPRGPRGFLGPDKLRFLGFPPDYYETILTAFNTSSVDCWVKTENLANDVTTCLKRYEAERGGHVDWVSFQDALTNLRHNNSTHASCSEYYDADSEALVRTADRHIFKLFGYTSCCDT
jgi:hypothetical protein